MSVISLDKARNSVVTSGKMPALTLKITRQRTGDIITSAAAPPAEGTLVVGELYSFDLFGNDEAVRAIGKLPKSKQVTVMYLKPFDTRKGWELGVDNTQNLVLPSQRIRGGDGWTLLAHADVTPVLTEPNAEPSGSVSLECKVPQVALGCTRKLRLSVVVPV